MSVKFPVSLSILYGPMFFVVVCLFLVFCFGIFLLLLFLKDSFVSDPLYIKDRGIVF